MKKILFVICAIALIITTTKKVYATEWINYIHTEIAQEKTAIDLTAFRVKDDEIIKSIENEYNYNTIWNNVKSFKCEYDNSHFATKLYVTYSGSMRQAGAPLAMIETSARRYETDAARIKFVYNFLTIYYQYDFTLQNESIPSFLTTHKGTCIAFAMTFKKILNDLGYECNIVLTTDKTHCYNEVIYNNKKYTCDLVVQSAKMHNNNTF